MRWIHKHLLRWSFFEGSRRVAVLCGGQEDLSMLFFSTFVSSIALLFVLSCSPHWNPLFQRHALKTISPLFVFRKKNRFSSPFFHTLLAVFGCVKTSLLCRCCCCCSTFVRSVMRGIESIADNTAAYTKHHVSRCVHVFAVCQHCMCAEYSPLRWMKRA